jgi:hypothetical protein
MGLTERRFVKEQEILLHPFSCVVVAGIAEEGEKVTIRLKDLELVSGDERRLVRYAVKGEGRVRFLSVDSNVSIEVCLTMMDRDVNAWRWERYRNVARDVEAAVWKLGDPNPSHPDALERLYEGSR